MSDTKQALAHRVSWLMSRYEITNGDALAREIFAAWRTGVEDAACVCDAISTDDPEGPWFNHDMSAGAMECAAAIRKLTHNSPR